MKNAISRSKINKLLGRGIAQSTDHSLAGRPGDTYTPQHIPLGTLIHI